MLENVLQSNFSVRILNESLDVFFPNGVMLNEMVEEITQELNLVFKREVRIFVVDLLFEPVKVFRFHTFLGNLLLLLFFRLAFAELIVEGGRQV